MELYEEKVTGVVESILADYQKGRDIDKMAIFNQPDPQVIREIVHSMLKIIYPGYQLQGLQYGQQSDGLDRGRYL